MTITFNQFLAELSEEEKYLVLERSGLHIDAGLSQADADIRAWEEYCPF